MLNRRESMSGLLSATEGVQLATIGNEAEAPESPFVADANGHAKLQAGGASTNSLDANIPEEYRKESKLFPLSSLDKPTSSFSSEGGRPFSVRRCFLDSTVLLTGATGYVGSLVMEHLLRTSPSCRIVIAIRGKLDAKPKARMEKLLRRQLFQQLADEREELFSRITVLDADLSEPNCGIKVDDIPSLASVDYIVHCAASIRFDLPVSVMMKQNYLTTSNLLDLAEEHMPKLKCFTYVSTAFVNFPQPDGTCVAEDLFLIRPGGDWRDDIKVAERLSQLPMRQAQEEGERVMAQAGFLNTYMLSKNLTEKMVMLRDGKPNNIVIVRPSLIGAVSGAPCPGYVGNTSGFTGVILGVGAGIITMSNHDPHKVFPLVPADIVSSLILAATAAVGADGGRKTFFAPRIVHACTSSTMPVSGERLQVLATNYMNEDPIEKRVVWHKDYNFIHTASGLRYRLHCLVRGLKLRLFTFMLRIMGYPRIAEKIMDMWYQYQLVGSKDAQINVTFDSSAAGTLYGMLTQEERGLYKVLWHADLQDSWLRYVRTYCAGTKHYYLNQAPRVFDMQDFSPSLIVGSASKHLLRSRSRSNRLTPKSSRKSAQEGRDKID